MGHPEPAATACTAAVALLEQSLGKNDAIVGLALSNLATFLHLDKKSQQAVGYAQRALKVLSTVLGKHNDTTRNCAVNLANIYKTLQVLFFICYE